MFERKKYFCKQNIKKHDIIPGAQKDRRLRPTFNAYTQLSAQRLVFRFNEFISILKSKGKEKIYNCSESHALYTECYIYKSRISSVDIYVLTTKHFSANNYTKCGAKRANSGANRERQL